MWQIQVHTVYAEQINTTSTFVIEHLKKLSDFQSRHKILVLILISLYFKRDGSACILDAQQTGLLSN